MPNKRQELLKNRSMKKSSINKAIKERNDLMLSLDKKIRQAKIKEVKIIKEMKADQLIAKQKDKEIREKNRLSVEKQKSILRTKKEAAKIKNSTFRKKMKSISANINSNLALNKQKTDEKLRGIKFAKRADFEKRKKEQEKIKLEALEKKFKLQEEKQIEIEKRKKINEERLKVLSEEKIAITKAKVKLSYLRSEKRMLESARRKEKLEKARIARIEQEKVKEEARLRFKEEISSIKYGKISKKIKIEKEIKEEKEAYNKELDKIDEETNKAIYDTKLSIEGMELEKKLSGEELEIDYSHAFEKISETQEIKKEKLVEANIEGSTIASFGRKGMKKYKIANKVAVEADISKYKRFPDLLQSISSFREINYNKNPIKISTFKPYLELLLDVEISEEKFRVFQSHLVTALLTKHSIKFANGYIQWVPSRGGNTVEFTKQLLDKNSLIALSDKALEKKSNELALKKLKSGGHLKIAKGLIATIQENEIVILQDTNFTKA